MRQIAATVLAYSLLACLTSGCASKEIEMHLNRNNQAP